MKALAILMGGILLASASTVAAQQTGGGSASEETAAYPILAEAQRASNPAARLAALDRALTVLARPGRLRGQVLCARGETLADLNRIPEAVDSLGQCRQLLPDDPRARVLTASFDITHSRAVEAAAMLVEAMRINADALNGLDPELINTLTRQLTYIDRRDVARGLNRQLVAAGYQRDDAMAFSGRSFEVLTDRIEANDRAGALALLPSVLAPDDVLALLVDRRFAPIWPEVERWAGDDLTSQRQAVLAAAAANYERERDDRTRIRYARALEQTGHVEQAIALLHEWLDRPPARNDDTWERGSGVSTLGRMMGSNGQRAEAISMMRASITSLQVGEGEANVAANLAIQLLLAQRWGEALTLAGRYDADVGRMEHPAAAGWFVALRACAIEGQGHHDDASRLLAEMRDRYATNVGAVDYVTSCVAPPDEQAATLIARMNDTDDRAGVLLEIAAARYRREHSLPVQSLRDGMLRRLIDRPDVTAAYARYGRAVPTQYEPALNNFNGIPDAAPRSSQNTAAVDGAAVPAV